MDGILAFKSMEKGNCFDNCCFPFILLLKIKKFQSILRG